MTLYHNIKVSTLAVHSCLSIYPRISTSHSDLSVFFLPGLCLDGQAIHHCSWVRHFLFPHNMDDHVLCLTLCQWRWFSLTFSFHNHLWVRLWCSCQYLHLVPTKQGWPHLRPSSGCSPPLAGHAGFSIWVDMRAKVGVLGWYQGMPWDSGLQVHGTCVFSLVLLTLNSDVLFSSYCDGLLLGLYYDLVGLMGLSSRWVVLVVV